jgi:FkbM family methyltransferase
MTPSRQYFGLNNLDQRLEPFINFDRGYFLEIGANDGVTQSNTLYYERHREWTGSLVEPFPTNFFKCRRNRVPQTKVFCAACVPFGYSERFVPIVYSNLMSISEIPGGDINDIRQHALTGRQFLQPDEEVFTFGAEARTLQDILVTAQAPKKIDLFSLDVEGVELQVLEGVDHNTFRFAWLLVECRSFPRMNAYLVERGYKFICALSEHDYLFTDIRG